MAFVFMAMVPWTGGGAFRFPAPTQELCGDFPGSSQLGPMTFPDIPIESCTVRGHWTTKRRSTMFFLTYLRRELTRRAGRTFLTVAGLAVGVTLVVAITAVSGGLDVAQAKVLDPLAS